MSMHIVPVLLPEMATFGTVADDVPPTVECMTLELDIAKQTVRFPNGFTTSLTTLKRVVDSMFETVEGYELYAARLETLRGLARRKG